MAQSTKNRLSKKTVFIFRNLKTSGSKDSTIKPSDPTTILPTTATVTDVAKSSMG
ncbi:hypothetical protein [Pedobacter agri]|uniref:hypothetical protein n=1 Tax=Pedobacter agri TaxID=454586 RepID=UPI002931771C|nr:hypothetical protein [Pedobacter agri]